jgi:hypothetical protein
MKKYMNYLCVLILFFAAASVVNGQLVASYSFEESWDAAGDPLINSVAGESGAWDDGTASSSAFNSNVEGVSLTGVSFSGQVSFDTGVSLADGADFTLMGWAKCPTSTSNRGFLFGQYSGDGNTGSNNFYITAADNRSPFNYKAGVFINGQRLNSTVAYNDNQWHFFAFTYDGTTARLYADGVEVDSLAIANLDLNQNSNLAIGNLSHLWAQSIPAQGHYDELKVYDTALSAAEILAIYEAKIEVVIEQTDGKTEVLEGGYTDSYSISIGSEPTDDVMITATPPASLDLGAGAGVATILTFTASNWTTAQTVTVTAVNDSVFIGSRIEEVTHSITSDDVGYAVASVGDVDVSIIDDDITINDGLVAYYKLDASVSTTNNIVANAVYGHSGTWPHGLASGQLDFNVDGYIYSGVEMVEVATLPAIDPNGMLSPTGDFTLAGWAKSAVSPANRGMMFGQHHGDLGNTAGNMYLMHCDKSNDYKARLFLGANIRTLESSESYNDGQWHYYVATRNGDTFSLYVDGVLVDSETSAGVTLNDYAAGGLAIGNLSSIPTRRIVSSGTLDELQVYTSALSAAQIETDYLTYTQPLMVITETDESTRIIEGYSNDSYEVSLAVEPAADVDVIISSDVIDFGTGAGAGLVLTFTPANWNIAQQVVVDVEDDEVDNGAGTETITHMTESDDTTFAGRYTMLDVEIIDNDGGCGSWGYKTADVNFDCRVDIEDLSIIAANWLKCTDPTNADCILP